MDLEPAEVVDVNKVADNCNLFQLIVVRVEKKRAEDKKPFCQTTNLRDHVNERECFSFVMSLLVIKENV